MKKTLSLNAETLRLLSEVVLGNIRTAVNTNPYPPPPPSDWCTDLYSCNCGQRQASRGRP